MGEKVRTALNVEKTTRFWDEFTEELQYAYFGGHGNENNLETFDTDFVIQNVNGQTTTATYDYLNLSLAALLKISEGVSRSQSNVKKDGAFCKNS